MNIMNIKAGAIILLLSMVLSLSGCGETLNGMTKDVKRMGKGIRTFFVRGE